MGREIRRVPPHWNHPRYTTEWGAIWLKPMLDQTLEQAQAKWDDGQRQWAEGTHKSIQFYPEDTWIEYEGERPGSENGIPTEKYRPWTDDEATWYQLWETVSEGTPVSPSFATLDELCKHLAEVGEFYPDRTEKDPWGSCSGPWGWDRAKAFCEMGWAPSGMVVVGPNRISTYDSKDIPLVLKDG